MLIGLRTLRSRIGFAIALTCVVASFGGVEAQADEACSNEVLRDELSSGALPDCRAYELVSPVYKAGGQFAVENVSASRTNISENGSHMISFALGAFAETKSEPFENTVYELSRTGSGWVASALTPPGSLSSESNFFGASKDLSRTLWGLHSPSASINEEALYVREPDGSFVEVGPMVPPAYGSGPPAGTTTTFGRSGLIKTVYLAGGGASSDLSHVLVSVLGSGGIVGVGDRWPGDSTLAQENTDSLYEYVGTGLARPELVGVDSEGKQISQCGIDLGVGTDLRGFGESERYDAVSANGETVFFTAEPGGCTGLNGKGEEVTGTGPPVKDLYARLDRKETVNISEPGAPQCEHCQTGVSEVKTTEMPAEFAGASEDGSKAFFTTEQELLEGQTTNNLYEYDFNNPKEHKIGLVSTGSPTPEVQSVARVSEDGSHVYFVAKGVLTGEPRGGGCFTELTAAELAEEESGKKEGRCRPKSGQDNLYVSERNAANPAGQVRFIATLPESRLGSAETTPDGRFLVFTSVGDLTADDTSTVNQVFEYDAQEEILQRCSIGQCEPPTLAACAPGERFNNDGNTMTDPAEIKGPEYSLHDAPAEAESRLSVSNNGSYVFFESVDNLTAGATAAEEGGGQSVYEYYSAGSIAEGNVYLISDGKDISRSFGLPRGDELIATDASGDDVFFMAGDPLLATDTNGEYDVYDAKIAGGFPEPVAPVGCIGEKCQGTAARSPLFGSPGSASAVAGGNITSAAKEKPPVLGEPRGPPQPTKRLTRAQKLANALRVCAKDKPKKRRATCEAQARKRYGVKSKAKSASGERGR